MGEEETIKRLRVDLEVALQTYRMAIDVWGPAKHAAEAAKIALYAAHAVWNKLDRDLYLLIKEGGHNE